MKSSIVIVLFFALGILLNLYGLYPSYLEQLDLIRGEKRCVSKFGRSENI